MATKIITKNSSTTTAIPTAGDLVQGELAVNVTDKRLFTENSAGAIVELGTNPSTIDINAGTIDGTVIGGTTAAAGSFTTLGTTGAATFSGNVNSTAAGENLFSNVGNVSLAVQSSATDKISIGVEQGVGGTFVASGGALKFRVGGYTAAFDKAQIDPSGNLGIGTSSPANMLHLSNSSEGTHDLAFSRNTTYGTSTGLGGISWYNQVGDTKLTRIDSQTDGSATNTRLIFSTASSGTLTERLRIDSAGNVKLITANDTAGTFKSLTFGTINYNRAEIRCTNAATYDGSLEFYTGNAANYQERMRIDASGNLLVGKTTTTFGTAGIALRGTVADFTRDGGTPINVNRLTSDGSLIDFHKAGTVVGSIGTGSGLLTIGTGTGNLLFENALVAPCSTSALGASDGVVDLGASARRFKNLHLSGSAISAISRVKGPIANGNSGILSAESSTAGDLTKAAMSVIKYDNSTSTSQVFFRFLINQGGAACGQINANGASQAAFGSWSDATLKENIVDLPDQYDNIRALRPVEFDYIESEGGEHQIGFIAQEMQEVYPCCVGERDDGKLTISGWSKTEARLVSALQSAMNKIEDLTARLEALEGA